MCEYLNNYIKEIDDLIKGGKVVGKDIDNHLVKIKFFQHERFIHLIVTCFYAIFLLLSIFICTFIPLFGIVFFFFFVFLLFSFLFFFFFENGVQYLYKQYDEMLKLK